MLKKPITIDGWGNGIGTSPHTGFQEMLNTDIFNVDGILRPNFQLFQVSDSPVTTTFTANAGTNVITTVGTFSRTIGGATRGPNDRVVQVSTAGTLPSGLAASTNYFIVNSSSGTSFQLAATLGGSPIALGTAGSGTLNINSVDPATINYFAFNKDTNLVYGQDVNGLIWQYISGFWKLLAGNTLTNALGNGLIVWNNYLLAFRQGYIDAYGPLNGSPSWTNGFVTLKTTASTPFIDHFPFISTDTNLYFPDLLPNLVTNNFTQAYLEGLVQVTGKVFAPGDATTFIAHVSSPVPFLGGPGQFEPGEIITCLEQLGSNLMIATNKNHIYPWDRSSPTYNIPIWTAENYIHSMVNINNVLYISCGNKGNLYKTYGTYAVKILDFSDYLSGFPQFIVFESQITKYQGRLMFALSGNATTAADQISGVFTLSLESGQQGAGIVQSGGGAYQLDCVASGGLGVSIPDILVFSDANNTSTSPNTRYNDTEFNVFVSWASLNNSSVGIDQLSVYSLAGPFRATGGLCQVASQIYQVGDANEPQTTEKFLINLVKPLSNGESITIQFRNNDTLGSAWSSGVTFTGTATPSAPTISTTTGQALGGGMGLQDNVNLENCIWLQALVTLNAAPNSGGTAVYSCPELRNVDIY